VGMLKEEKEVNLKLDKEHLKLELVKDRKVMKSKQVQKYQVKHKD
jgi:hypothetical protein